MFLGEGLVILREFFVDGPSIDGEGFGTEDFKQALMFDASGFFHWEEEVVAVEPVADETDQGCAVFVVNL